jgi:hypothetical protein
VGGGFFFARVVPDLCSGVRDQSKFSEMYAYHINGLACFELSELQVVSVHLARSFRAMFFFCGVGLNQL